jgi:predicted ATPase
VTFVRAIELVRERAGEADYECTPDGLQPVAYDDLDHVRLTRSFLEDPERFLRHLLAE